jgi:hypothetical protein
MMPDEFLPSMMTSSTLFNYSSVNVGMRKGMRASRNNYEMIAAALASRKHEKESS